MVEHSVFTLDENSKKTIKQIASKTQIPFDSIKSVFEYTLFNSALNILNSNKKFKEITIPYFGRIVIKQRENPNDELGKYEAFFICSDNLKIMLEKFDNDDFSSLEEFIDKKVEQRLDSVEG